MANSGTTRQRNLYSAGAPISSNQHSSILSTEKRQNSASGWSSLIDSLSQQKLKAWQPVLKPECVSAVFVILGLLFIGCGVLLILVNQSVIECEVIYDDAPVACDDIISCTTETIVEITESNCVGLIPDSPTITAPVFLYYRLTKYYQNHRNYAASRSDAQLGGSVITNPEDLKSCSPLVMDPQLEGKDVILSPCGLIAASVFNDTFSLVDESGAVSMDESAETIAWQRDLQYYKNPSPTPDPAYITEWLHKAIFPGGVENGHFIVWMRIAALSNFRKLYAKIDRDLTLPITVTIQNRYPVSSFGGTKRVVLSQTSFLGGRSMFLGVAYEVLGSGCLIFGIILIIKNYRKPRLMGDVRHLNRIFNRRSKRSQ